MTHIDHVKQLLALISPRDQVMFAAACAERALTQTNATDARLWNAIKVARLVALGEEKPETARAARASANAAEARARAWAWANAAWASARAAEASVRAARASANAAEARARAAHAAWASARAAEASARARATESKKIEREQQIHDLQRYLAGRDAEPEVLAVDLDAALERGIDPVVATWAPWAQKAVMYNGVKTADLMKFMDFLA